MSLLVDDEFDENWLLREREREVSDTARKIEILHEAIKENLHSRCRES